VQIGSFAKQTTADKLSQDLKRRGYASFVVPFKTGAQTLYRVRVGPMTERGEADAILQKLKREGTAATVVANG
jgi:cell division septation protein DedD